jgi:hypothetical protein
MACHDMRFVHGSTHLLSGPSGSGKSVRLCKILANKNTMIVGGERIKNVVLAYVVWQPIYTMMKEQGIVTHFVQKKPSCEDFIALVEKYKDDGGSIFAIDDMMAEIDLSFMEIVTVHSRHYNTSTFILFQSLFPPNKLARQISLNVKYLHLLKNPREQAQISTLARQLSPKDYKWIVDAYYEVTKDAHGALLIDMTQTREDELRYRSHYLPSESPMRVYMSKQMSRSCL